MDVAKEPLHRLAMRAVAKLASELEDSGGAERRQPHAVTASLVALRLALATAFVIFVVASLVFRGRER